MCYFAHFVMHAIIPLVFLKGTFCCLHLLVDDAWLNLACSSCDEGGCPLHIHYRPRQLLVGCCWFWPRLSSQRLGVPAVFFVFFFVSVHESFFFFLVMWQFVLLCYIIDFFSILFQAWWVARAPT
jgi:hypothetical protein